MIETVSTLAGSGEGNRDGNGLSAQFYYPSALCMNPRDSCLYICESENFAIRKLTMQGISGKSALFFLFFLVNFL
jgi:hypothetical protein